MELDFSKLDAIAGAGKESPFPAASKSAETKTAIDAPGRPQGAAGNEGVKSYQAPAKRADSGPQGSGLARLEQLKSLHDRTAAALKEQQEGIKASERTKAEIIKDVRAGLDPIALFLKAVQGIGQATGDATFCKQVLREVMDIWGAGLLQKLPLEMELGAVESRLKLLKRNHIYESDARSRKRIEAAIAEHEARRKELQILLGTYSGPFDGKSQGRKEA